MSFRRGVNLLPCIARSKLPTIGPKRAAPVSTTGIVSGAMANLSTITLSRLLSLNTSDHDISNGRANPKHQQPHHNHNSEREGEQKKLTGRDVLHNLTASLRKVKNTASPKKSCAVTADDHHLRQQSACEVTRRIALTLTLRQSPASNHDEDAIAPGMRVARI